MHPLVSRFIGYLDQPLHSEDGERLPQDSERTMDQRFRSECAVLRLGNHKRGDSRVQIRAHAESIRPRPIEE